MLHDVGQLYRTVERGRGLIGCNKDAFLRAVDAGGGAVKLTLTEMQYRSLQSAGSKERAEPKTRQA